MILITFILLLLVLAIVGSTGFEGSRRLSISRRRKECEHDFNAKYVQDFKAAEICLKCYKVNYFSRDNHIASLWTSQLASKIKKEN